MVPPNWNGKTHCLLGSGPPTVTHVLGGDVVTVGVLTVGTLGVLTIGVEPVDPVGVVPVGVVAVDSLGVVPVGTLGVLTVGTLGVLTVCVEQGGGVVRQLYMCMSLSASASLIPSLCPKQSHFCKQIVCYDL